MSKFARLFDVQDSQVLYLLRADGNAIILEVSTNVEGDEYLTCSPVPMAEPVFAQSWKKATEYLKHVSQHDAEAFYAYVTNAASGCSMAFGSGVLDFSNPDHLGLMPSLMAH